MIDYIGEGAPKIPVPPNGALYYDKANGSLYGALPAVGEWAILGGSALLSNTPLVEAEVIGIKATTPQELSLLAPTTGLYAISIYMKAVGSAASGHTYTKTLTYTAADGSGVQTVTLILPLDTANVVMETYPLLVLGGTTISTVGAYGGGATNDPFTLAETITQMPG
jgi:hypothetical protein